MIIKKIHAKVWKVHIKHQISRTHRHVNSAQKFVMFQIITLLYTYIYIGFSMVSDSQGASEFVSSMPFSEDSNSQGSDGPSTKRLKNAD